MRSRRRVFDVTALLRRDANEYIFNPSFTLIRENDYFVSCRVFRRYPRGYTIPKPQIKSDSPYEFTMDPTHPWAGGPGGQWGTWWKTINGGYDYTRFAVIRLVDASVELVTLFDETLPAQDTRVVNLTRRGGPPRQLRLLFSYSINVEDGDLNILPEVAGANIYQRTCKNGCYLIGVSTGRLVYSTTNEYSLTFDGDVSNARANIMCPEICNYVEKNWSFFAIHDPTNTHMAIGFEYSLVPEHVQYILGTDNMKCGVDTTRIATPNPVMNALASLYTGGYPENFAISLTTPPYFFGDRIFCVGHVKFKWAEMERMVMQGKIPEELPLIQYLKTEVSTLVHPIYIYFMFVYSYEFESGRILSISDMFTVNKSNLVFPVGLVVNPDKIYISYGDMDAKCMVIELPTDDFSRMLHDVSSVTASTAEAYAKTIPFVSVNCVHQILGKKKN